MEDGGSDASEWQYCDSVVSVRRPRYRVSSSVACQTNEALLTEPARCSQGERPKQMRKNNIQDRVLQPIGYQDSSKERSILSMPRRIGHLAGERTSSKIHRSTGCPKRDVQFDRCGNRVSANVQCC